MGLARQRHTARHGPTRQVVEAAAVAVVAAAAVAMVAVVEAVAVVAVVAVVAHLIERGVWTSTEAVVAIGSSSTDHHGTMTPSSGLGLGLGSG